MPCGSAAMGYVWRLLFDEPEARLITAQRYVGLLSRAGHLWRYVDGLLRRLSPIRTQKCCGGMKEQLNQELSCIDLDQYLWHPVFFQLRTHSSFAIARMLLRC